MIGLLMNRRLRYVLMTPVAASLMSTGLSADTITPQVAMIVFVGALFAGWVLHGLILGLVRGLFSFWTPLIVLAILFGGPAAFSVLGPV